MPLPEDRASRVVVLGDFVTAEDGSGLVHMAPAFGADDYQAGMEHGLALVRPVAGDGTFTGTTWPEIEGRLVTGRETNDLIIQRLKQDGRWHLTQPHTHTYPHCWRCASPLIYYARDSWFVRTSAVKDRMLELNRQVDWHPPEVGAGRFGEWLENNVDWALSRDRYWGTPLPVWVCDRDASHVDVVGSYADLAARWGQPLPERIRSPQAVHRHLQLAVRVRRPQAPRARGHRHLVRFGRHAVRAVALSVRARGRVRRRTSRPTSSARASTRPAAGSTHSWPSRRPRSTVRPIGT